MNAPMAAPAATRPANKVRHDPHATCVNCVPGLTARLWQHSPVHLQEFCTMQPTTEVTLDLTAQELLDPQPVPVPVAIEVEDIGDVDPLLQTGSFVANADSAKTPVEEIAEDGTIELELTADQMDLMLRGRPVR
jgi:hypothetical protein